MFGFKREDGHMFRAICVDKNVKHGISFVTFDLIDVGNQQRLAFNDFRMYEVTDEAKMLLPYALPCIVKWVNIYTYNMYFN